MSNQYPPYPQYNQMAARQRRPGARLQGCGCLLLVLAVGAAFVLAANLTTGRTQTIVIAGGAGIFALLLLLGLLSRLLSQRGRERLREGCTEGCLEALFEGIFDFFTG